MTYLSLKLPLGRWKMAAGGTLCRLVQHMPGCQFDSGQLLFRQAVCFTAHQDSYFSISITKSCRWIQNNHSMIACCVFSPHYSSVAIHSAPAASSKALYTLALIFFQAFSPSIQKAKSCPHHLCSTKYLRHTRTQKRLQTLQQACRANRW